MESSYEIHSALSLVEALLSPHGKEFLTAFNHCSGYLLDKGRRCEKPIGAKRRESAAKIYDLLLGKQRFPEDFETLSLVEKFLDLRHCHLHIRVVQENFETWKLEHAVGGVTDSTHNGTSAPSHDKEPPINPAEIELPCAMREAMPTTPRRKPIRGTEFDTMSEYFSEFTISPGQESIISFSDASIASTAFTTPDTTPMISENLPLVDETDSAPATPSLSPRLPKEPIIEQALEELPEIKELCDQEDKKGPGMKDGVIRRLKTQRRGKIPLLIGLEHDWTRMDHESGRVYVFRHNKQHNLIKIGFTRSNAQWRYAQNGNCYAMDTTPHWESPAAFIGAYRVEQLVQKQLHDSNVLNYEGCGASCTKIHREWFRYDSEKAIALITVWTDFVLGGFYDIGVDDNGTKFGRLSPKGRVFMESVCNLNIEVLKQHIGVGSTNHSEIAEDISEAIPVTVCADFENVSGMADSSLGEGLQREPDNFKHDASEAYHVTLENKQEKHGARWHFMQIVDIKVHEVKELLHNPVLRAWDRRRHQGKDDSFPSQQLNVEETMHKFFHVFYANELDEIEPVSKTQSQGLRGIEKGKKGLLKQWRSGRKKL